MDIKKTIILLLSVILFFHLSNVDIALQNNFYHKGRWLIHSKETMLHFLCYSGLKFSVILVGIFFIIFCCFSYYSKKLEPLRTCLLIVTLSLVLVPLIVAGAKHITNVHCPRELRIYGGTNSDTKLLNNCHKQYVQAKRGKCFPAGHATTGFAFMSLFFAFRNRKLRILGLALGLILGWIAGIYQMLRGEHFLSHTVVTMILSWLVIICIKEFITAIGHSYYAVD